MTDLAIWFLFIPRLLYKVFNSNSHKISEPQSVQPPSEINADIWQDDAENAGPRHPIIIDKTNEIFLNDNKKIKNHIINEMNENTEWFTL